jgi:putative addiction module component (TIGR02574 family)
MARPLTSIEQEIRTLGASEEETLLHALWEELDGPPAANVEAAWLEEIHKRDRDIEEGRVEFVPADQVFRKLSESLKK